MRGLQIQGAVRSSVVVVLDVITQDALEMAAREDLEPIQTLIPHRPNPALGEGVRLKRAERRSDHLDAFGTE